MNLKSILLPWEGKHKEEAQRAVQESRRVLIQAKINGAFSRMKVQEMDDIVAANNFGAHAARALRLNGSDQ